MKKILTALVLCLVSIMFVACSGSQPKSSTQNVNVNVSESTAKWEYLGEVECFAGGESGYKGIITYAGTGLWVKQIGGQTYYKAGWTNNKYSLSPNPHYGKDCKAGQARYKFVKDGIDCYVIF